jgi:hypothetical protein
MSEQTSTEIGSRKAYEPPRFEYLGTVEQITLAKGAFTNRDCDGTFNRKTPSKICSYREWL